MNLKMMKMKTFSNLTGPPSSLFFWRWVALFRADGRQKRMQEIREFNSAARYGTVEPLTKPDFVKQVTEQSDSVWVFVHLFKD
jgi:hypothetical protein